MLPIKEQSLYRNVRSSAFLVRIRDTSQRITAQNTHNLYITVETLPDFVGTYIFTIYNFIPFTRLSFCPPYVHCGLTIPLGTIKDFPFVVRRAE